jgi:hypothetical protein
MSCPEVVTGNVEIRDEDYVKIQQEANQGKNLWRLSPVRTAQEVGASKLGLSLTDAYTLVEQYRDSDSGLQYAVVRVTHRTCKFLLDLFQPVKQGKGGIWVVQTVTPLS